MPVSVGERSVDRLANPVVQELDDLKTRLAPDTFNGLDSSWEVLQPTDGGKDVTVATDDFLLDQVERDQQEQTQRRRENRSRRRQLYALGTLALVGLLLVGAPSLVSHSSIGRSLLISALSGYELNSSVQSIRIGWVTPLRIEGLQMEGVSGSKIAIDQLTADVTVGDLLRSNTNNLGEVGVRGVIVSCAVDHGSCNLEDDLRLLMAPGDQPSSLTAQIKLQDISFAVTDVVSGGTWQLSQSNADAIVSPGKTEGTFAGVLTEPGGDGGSLQGAVLYSPRVSPEHGHPENTRTPEHGLPEQAAQRWRLEIACESLPLSVATLVRRRVTELAPYVPSRVHGDATGSLLVQSLVDGTVHASIDDLRVRNLTAADEGSRVWSNGLATISGELVLQGDRVIGRRLMAATDFASATIDGAFSRTFSLVGANDNPLRWLDAIDGTATAEIDLAAFDRSLPGVLPLREDATILSGRVMAKVDSTPNGQTRRSQLLIETEALRARARGQAVIIDPIKLSASVSNDRGQLKADQFEWKSTFGSAIGHGDLRSGIADFEIDFGRLTSMLRPILQVSETTLAGTASGSIQWNASADSTWRLSGSADANDLLITFPSGQSLRRESLRGVVDAVGRWGGQSLDELSSANVSLVSSGLDLQAELIEAVRQPDTGVPMPIRFQGTGRMETLAEAIGPWLPNDFAKLQGGFQLTARAEVATTRTRLTNASLVLTEPSMFYANRHFNQSKMEVEFDGVYLWPNQDFEANDLTVSGNAFSLRVAGKANNEEIDLDIHWRALLDRLQGSVRKPLAMSAGESPFRQAGYRTDGSTSPTNSPTKTMDEWSLAGDCDGSVLVKRNQGMLDFEIDAKGRNLAVLQPLEASPQYQFVGPVPPNQSVPPNQNAGSSNPSAAGSNQGNGSQPGLVVWSEPNFKVAGLIRYDAKSSAVTTEALQLAGDWFATTLKGRLERSASGDAVLLEGPARLKMHEVAARLSSLLGMTIRAEGIQETPLLIRASYGQDGNTNLSVRGNLGWEEAEVAGVQLGPASVPVRLSESTLEIPGSRIPVGQGFVNLAGQVHYRPDPIWVQLDRGVVAKDDSHHASDGQSLAEVPGTAGSRRDADRWNTRRRDRRGGDPF